MRLNCSFNIYEEQDNSNQMSVALNIGTSTAYGSDIPGESRVYGVVNNILINISVMPTEIKEALMQSGVKFL